MQQGMTRRTMLQAGAAAGLAALAADPLVKSALASMPAPGKLSDVEHVVFLIQENRSFDHYFGTLPGVRGFTDGAEKGVLAQPGYPVEGYEGHLEPFHLDSTACFHDITHSWVPQHASWHEGAMDGFVEAHLAADGSSAGPATMGYYEKADIPVYHALAEMFTICDSYFCSVLGPTDPNRLYSLSGTIDPEGANGGPLIETLIPPKREKFNGTFTWQTMPEALSSAGISWKVYNGDDGSGGGIYDNELTYFKNFQSDAKLQEKAFTPAYPHDFEADVKNGQLPQVSWINASLAQTEHPGNSTARVGEYVASRIIKALWSHKELWKKTALFITWDENGGFFDHVAPPAPPGRHDRRVPHRAGHQRQLRWRQRSGRPRLPGPDADRLAVHAGRLSQLGHLRPHLDAALPRDALRRGSSEPQRVASRNHRRPHERVQLRRSEPETGDAPEGDDHQGTARERRMQSRRLRQRAAELHSRAGFARMAAPERAVDGIRLALSLPRDRREGGSRSPRSAPVRRRSALRASCPRDRRGCSRRSRLPSR